MSHHCHWPGCQTEVPPKLWGCRPHWYSLPKYLRDRIWATYRPGQEVTKTPSLAYLAAAHDVQEWIKNKESAFRCQWDGCAEVVEGRLWACPRHWPLLPFDLRSRVWAVYEPGATEKSAAYNVVVDEIRAWIVECRRSAASRAAAELERKSTEVKEPEQTSLFE